MEEAKEILSALRKLNNSVAELQQEIMMLKGRDTLGDDPLIPQRELLQILDLNERSIRRYRKNGWIAPVTIQRRLFYRKSDIRNLIENHLIK